MPDYRDSKGPHTHSVEADRVPFGVEDRENTELELIAELSRIALKQEPASISEIVTHAIRTGIPTERIVDHIIPEVARNLGDAWCVDQISFADVTIGVARLQAMLRDVEPATRSDLCEHAESSTVLLAVAETTHHTLGAMVLAIQLRRVGLSVRLLLGATQQLVRQTCSATDYDAVFISANISDSLENLRRIVDSTKRDIGHTPPVVVGGSLLETQPDIVALTGADYAAKTADEAIALCNLKTKPRANTVMDQ